MNRKLSAVSAFFEFHHRHGRGPGDLLATWRPRARAGRGSRCVLGSITPRQERQPAEHPDHQQADKADEHERRA
ncbi:MAG: hypothetical protein ACRDPO_11930 [Streptosporangiaceae bacterium]